MMRLSLPPLTKALLLTVLTLSFVVGVLRYHTYYLWSQEVAKQDQQALENASSQELGDGKNFPPDQKTQYEVPSTSHLYVPFLTIVPGQSHVYYPWIVLSATFVEDSVLALIFTATTLLYGARYCENVWGSKELGKFTLIQTIIPNLFALGFYSIVAYASEGPPVTICGSTALVSGFLVAFKQLVPEHSIILFRGLIRLKVKQLPLAFLVISTLMGIVSHDLYAIHAWVGFFTSWIYLRFIRTTYADPVLPFSNSTSLVSHEHTTPDGVQIRGDASDSFALCEFFFPEPVRFVVGRVADSVFHVITTCRLMEPFTTSEIDSANTRALARVSSMTPPPAPRRAPAQIIRGSARAEAERRRSLALRALESGAPKPNSSSSNSSPPTTSTLQQPPQAAAKKS